jgi:hypothetical protein
MCRRRWGTAVRWTTIELASRVDGEDGQARDSEDRRAGLQKDGERFPAPGVDLRSTLWICEMWACAVMSDLLGGVGVGEGRWRGNVWDTT